MIHSVFLRSLRNGEFIRFNKDVLSICADNNAAALGIEAQILALKTVVGPLDDLFVKEKGNMITPELEALDARRDAALIGIRLSAETAGYHYTPATAAAGKQLLAAIDKYGRNLPRLNYIAETEVIVSLTGDLADDAALSAAVSVLKLNDWVKELSTANTLFNTRYLARNSNYAARSDGKLNTQRELVIDAWQQLDAHITAHATLTPSDDYNKLVKEINSLIEQYNRVVNDRKGTEEELPAEDVPAGADEAL